MWPFSETNAAAMRTLKTQSMPIRQWETKDQEGVTIAPFFVQSRPASATARAGAS
jgi:hypothetical protein